jgi:2-dehydropantoate 2-reductase
VKIAIIGAGAMGSLFGAKLSPLVEVWLISSWLQHVQAMQTKGLKLTELDGKRRTVSVNATTHLDDAGGNVDLAIICVKSHHTELASQRAALLLKPHGLALTMQNGLGNLEQMAAVLGMTRAVQGVTSHGATLIKPGHIRHAGAGPSHLATRPYIAERMAAIQAIFERAGFETHLSDNLDSLLWGKLIINVGINALTAVLRIPNGVLASVEPANKLMAAAVEEAVQVARAKEICLPYDDPQAQVKQVARATASNRSSMLADVTRTAPTEIDVINGAIVREGQKLGIQTPVNQLLVWLIKAIEESYEERL